MRLKAFLSEAFIFCWCCLVTAAVAGIAFLMEGLEVSIAAAVFAFMAIGASIIYGVIPLGEFIRGKIFK